MSNRLEKFIEDNREAFDSDEPRHQVWRDLQAKVAENKKDDRIFHLGFLRWTAAAAVVIMLVGTIYYVIEKGGSTPTIASLDNQGSPATPDQVLTELNPTYAKEVYHFTQLIELKQSELKQIEKEHPELYQQFVKDINKLDSSYQALKTELPKNANRELLLEAMIQNLQLQAELLNQQLSIIKTLNQKNKQNNENNPKDL
jgi:hypothetical protein